MSVSTTSLFSAAQRRALAVLRTLGVLTFLGICAVFMTAPYVTATAQADASAAGQTDRRGPALVEAADISSTRALNPAAAALDSGNPTDRGIDIGLRGFQRDDGSLLVVPDPRIGDLRDDPQADVLPVSYSPQPAAAEQLDLAYGSDPQHRLDLYLPGSADAPLIMYLHAGGWVAGDKDEVPDLVMRFVERGYAVASVGYRLAPDNPFPAPLEDAKLALRWLKSYGASTGSFDGNRTVVVGASAGAHLATMIAATPGRFEPAEVPPALESIDSTVAGLVNLVGPTDLTQLYFDGNDFGNGLTAAFLGCDPCDVDELSAASPAFQLDTDLAPAYWAFGTEDGLVPAGPQGETIADAWADHSGWIGSWLDLVDGAGHNLDESLVNQRFLEAFVDIAVGRAMS